MSLDKTKTTQDKIMDKYLEKTQSNTVVPITKDNKYNQGGKFNEALFNKDFQDKIVEQIKYAEMLETQKLNEINNYYIYERKKEKEKEKEKNTISSFLVDWNDNIRNIVVDILKFDYNFTGFLQIFTQDNRMFYVGITIITIFVIYYFIKSYFFYNENNQCEQKATIKNYIYHLDNNTDKLNNIKKITNDQVNNQTKNAVIDMANNQAKDVIIDMANNQAKNVTETISNSSGGYIFAEKLYKKQYIPNG